MQPWDSHSLKDSYFPKVLQNLSRITKLVQRLQHDPSNRGCFREIVGYAENISDLAMIHGYDGVEKIADKITRTFIDLDRKNKPFNHALFLKMDVALQSIQEVIELEDSLEQQMMVEKVHTSLSEEERIRLKTEDVEDYSALPQDKQIEMFEEQKVIRIVDEANDKHLNNADVSDSLAFDINEDAAFCQLEDDIRKVDSTLDLFES